VRTEGSVRDLKSGLRLQGAGVHHLDGTTALAWVRSRHLQVLRDRRWVPVEGLDPTRTEHAAQVLAQALARLDDPVTVQRAAWAVGPRLRRDERLGAFGLVDLGRGARGALASGSVRTVPARASGTEVPFAFPAPQTWEALAPFRSDGCAVPGS
jgi:hypothetical protein